MKDTLVKAFLKSNKDELVKPTVVLLCICIIIPLALAVTNLVTEKRILDNEKQNTVATMKELIAADTFNEKQNKKGDFTYNEAVKDGKVIAYIMQNSAKGYGGDVIVMTAISPQGTVIDIAILDVQNETPGLGQNVAKPDFYSQFKGSTDKISINDVDAVTGATYSSKAVTTAVNEALKNFSLIDIPKREPLNGVSANNNSSEAEVPNNEEK